MTTITRGEIDAWRRRADDIHADLQRQIDTKAASSDLANAITALDRLRKTLATLGYIFVTPVAASVVYALLHLVGAGK